MTRSGPLADRRPRSSRSRAAARVAAALAVGAIRVYRLCLSPWLGRNCRFVPTCSGYAIEAIERYGAARGGWLALRRVGRCHPWGGSGYDPVPEAADSDGRAARRALREL